MSFNLFKIVPESARSFSTSGVAFGKKNFRKFLWINRGTQDHKEDQRLNPDPRYTPDYGVRKVLFTENGQPVLESIPQLVVPDLSGFKLKPYMSYRINDVSAPEFTAKDLFCEIYGEKIRQDFIDNKLDEQGNPLSPSEMEMLSPEEAEIQARKTGSDLFDEDVDVGDRTQITKDYYL